MSTIDQELVAKIVKNVMNELDSQPRAVPVSGKNDGIFDTVDEAITATAAAQKIWARTSREIRGKVIEALRRAMHENADTFARMALEETGMGRFEDKVFKHHNVADVTPGIEDLETRSWIGDKGLVVEDYAPYGVIAAITPSTHPHPTAPSSAWTPTSQQTLTGSRGVRMRPHKYKH